MDKYIEAEIQIGRSLGYLAVQRNKNGRVIGYEKQTGKLKLLPRWSRNNADAFSLMVEHGIEPSFHDEAIFPLDNWVPFKYADHPDKETTVRYAIVQAVIAKLSNQA